MHKSGAEYHYTLVRDLKKKKQMAKRVDMGWKPQIEQLKALDGSSDLVLDILSRLNLTEVIRLARINRASKSLPTAVLARMQHASILPRSPHQSQQLKLVATNCKNLRRFGLRMSKRRSAETIKTLLANCTKLETIENIVASPFLSDTVPVLPNLTAIRVSVHGVNEIDVMCQKCPNLQHIELFNEIWSNDPYMCFDSVLNTYPNLRSLELFLFEMTPRTLEKVSHLQQLETLGIYAIEIGDDDLISLSRNVTTSLTCLQLGGMSITKRGIEALLRKLPNLQSLDVEYAGITQTELLSILLDPSLLKRLERLYVPPESIRAVHSVLQRFHTDCVIGSVI